MRAICVCGVLCSALVGLWAPVARADEAAPLYDPSAVYFIDLTLSAEAEAKLEAEPDEYVKGTFSMTKSSNGTPAGEEATPFIASRPAEIRLKGSVGGSFRPIDEKAGFKLKFKKADAVLGLRKMTLNNMVQDPSMVHEALAYAAFRAAGAPASRTGFAYVRLNGDDIGVYLDLENLDDIGLARIFGSFDDETQHLYEGEQGDDVFPGGEAGFEVDEGPEGDITDLEALIAAVNDDLATGESWSKHVSPNADLAEMTKMWAVEKYIDHWDGYSGHTEPSQAGSRPNNYYLFSDSNGRFQMMPWGTDQAWVFTKGVSGREVTFDGEGGVLFNMCLEDKECFRTYWETLGDVTKAIAALDPASLAEDIADLLGPWQAKESADGRPEYDAVEIKEGPFGVEETIEFIEGRQSEAEEWLAENKPPLQTVIVAGPPAEHPSPLSSTPGRPGPALLFERAKRFGRQLTTRVQLAGPGQVSLRATFRVDKGKKRACTASERAQIAGDLALHCTLSRSARERLAHGALRLELRLAIALAAGGKETVVQRIRLARS